MRAAGVLVASLVVLAAAGCDWREFDKLKAKTPVAAIAPPSGYDADDDFGPLLLALAAPTDGSAAGRFLATATHRTAVDFTSFDAAGRASSIAVDHPGLDELLGAPVTAIAPLPGGREVLLGAPNPSLGDVLVMSLEPPHTTQKFIGTQGEPHYGVGLAAANLGAGPEPEIVVVSGSKLHVYVDRSPTMDKAYMVGASDPCPFEIPSSGLSEDDLLNRAVIVAPLLGSGMQIAVGAPTTSGGGHVSIFNFDATAGAVTCAMALTGAEAHFGRSMTLVDVDGNGTADHLLVGAPQTRAYLYSLPLSAGAAPVAMASETMPLANFGFSVAAFDIDGKPGDEMLVSSPDATVGNTTTAGRVFVYTGATMTLLPSTATFPNPLAEHAPGAGRGYGLAVAGMTFCPEGGGADAGAGSCTKLPLVGSRSKVFAYFTLGKTDPRVK